MHALTFLHRRNSNNPEYPPFFVYFWYAVDQKMALTRFNVVPMLLRLFESDHPEVFRIAVLALCNLTHNGSHTLNTLRH